MNPADEKNRNAEKEQPDFSALFKRGGKKAIKIKNEVVKKTKPFVAPTLLVIMAGGIFYFMSKRITRQLDKIKHRVDKNQAKNSDPK